MWTDLDSVLPQTVDNENFHKQLEKTLQTSREALKRLRSASIENSKPKDTTIYPYDSKDPALAGDDKTFSLPGLIEAMQSTDAEKRNSALRKLVEGCKKSAFASAAIYGSELLNKTMYVFQRSRRNSRYTKYEDEPMLIRILEILSTNQKCAEKMIKNGRFVSELYRIVYNIQTEQQHVAAKILSNISAQSGTIRNHMIKRNGAFNEINKIFNRPTCTIYLPIDLWRHLGHLIDAAPDKAVQKGFFDVLYHRIKHKMPQFYLENMKCFALLLRSKQARDIFDSTGDAIQIFYTMISTRSEITDYENTMEALDAALQSEYALVAASQFEDMPKHVLRIAKRQQTKETALHAFSIIRKFHKLAKLHDVLYKNCLPALKHMHSNDMDVQCAKSELMAWLQVNRYNFN